MNLRYTAGIIAASVAMSGAPASSAETIENSPEYDRVPNPERIEFYEESTNFKDNYSEEPDVNTACDEAAIAPPSKVKFKRYSWSKVDLWTGGKTLLPAFNARFKEAVVDENGDICDPKDVQRVVSANMYLGKPKKYIFDGVFLSNENKAITVGSGLGNTKKVKAACHRAEKSDGRVKLTAAVLALADSNGIVEQTDPANVYTKTVFKKCLEQK